MQAVHIGRRVAGGLSRHSTLPPTNMEPEVRDQVPLKETDLNQHLPGRFHVKRVGGYLGITGWFLIPAGKTLEYPEPLRLLCLYDSDLSRLRGILGGYFLSHCNDAWPLLGRSLALEHASGCSGHRRSRSWPRRGSRRRLNPEVRCQTR